MARIKDIKVGEKVYWKPNHHRSQIHEAIGHVLTSKAGKSEIHRTSGSIEWIENRKFITEAEAIEHEKKRIETENHLKTTGLLIVQAEQVMEQLEKVIGRDGYCTLGFGYHQGHGRWRTDLSKVSISTDALIRLLKIAGEVNDDIASIDIEALRIN
jgi:hypothetical protein